jgi:hypothetical protein
MEKFAGMFIHPGFTMAHSSIDADSASFSDPCATGVFAKVLIIILLVFFYLFILYPVSFWRR